MYNPITLPATIKYKHQNSRFLENIISIRGLTFWQCTFIRWWNTAGAPFGRSALSLTVFHPAGALLHWFLSNWIWNNLLLYPLLRRPRITTPNAIVYTYIHDSYSAKCSSSCFCYVKPTNNVVWTSNAGHGACVSVHRPSPFSSIVSGDYTICRHHHHHPIHPFYTIYIHSPLQSTAKCAVKLFTLFYLF